MLTIKSLVLLLSVLRVLKSHEFLAPIRFKGEPIVGALREILRKSFRHEFSTLNVLRATKAYPYGSDMVGEILLDSREEFAVQLDYSYTITNIGSRKRKYNVILLENIELFRILDKSIRPDSFNFKGFFFFVLLADGKIEEIREIFETLWRKNIYNTFAVSANGGSIDVITFMPFGIAGCENMTPRTISRFRNGSFDRPIEAIFTEKFDDLFNCPVIVSTFDDHFSVIRKRSTSGTVELSGFDLDLVIELSRALNFKADIRFYEGPEPWGSVFDNGTSTGSLGEIIKRKAQIAVGRYYLLEARRKVADSSISYFSFPAVFVISPGRTMSDFEKLAQPFSGIVWISLIITLAMAVVVILLVKLKLSQLRAIFFGTNTDNPLVNLVTVILGGSQTRLPDRNFSRFILMMFIIFCLVMRSAYVGSLYKFLQSEKREESVATIDEMIDQNYDLYMYSGQLNDFGIKAKSIAER